jgi:predicted RNA-binding protein
MCEANAYLIKDGEEHMFMKAVDIVIPEEEGTWRLVNIFGDQKIVKGKIKQMNLVSHKILFESQAD